VPSDPVFQARSEAFEDPFNEYAVPQAILRFRQGFGRLIRSHSDRGVVVVLDRRLTSRGYGRAFLRSLPGCEVREGPAGEAPSAARDWLGATELEVTSQPALSEANGSEVFSGSATGSGLNPTSDAQLPGQAPV